MASFCCFCPKILPSVCHCQPQYYWKSRNLIKRNKKMSSTLSLTLIFFKVIKAIYFKVNIHTKVFGQKISRKVMVPNLLTHLPKQRKKKIMIKKKTSWKITGKTVLCTKLYSLLFWKMKVSIPDHFHKLVAFS